MSTLTIEVSEAIEKRLNAEALRRGISIHDLVREIVDTSTRPQGQSFEEALKATFRDNDETYRKLAQ